MESVDPRHLTPAPFKALVNSELRLKIVDIGASSSDGEDPPYGDLLEAGDADLIGFEPHAASLSLLNRDKGAFETYLPHAVGDGGRHTLHICHAPGLNSLLTPNAAVMKLFHMFPTWSRVFSTSEVETVRLDDVPETKGVDFIKIDIQGGELIALSHATERLRSVSVVHAEVSFIPLYVGQPLFSEVELFLRGQGFMFHRFYPLVSRLFSPFMIGSELYSGMSQLMQADAIFVRDFTRPELFSDRQLMATATILHDCYHAFDGALFMLLELDHRHQTDLGHKYIGAMQQYFPKHPIWVWRGPGQLQAPAKP